jgi:hypothetical protein
MPALRPLSGRLIEPARTASRAQAHWLWGALGSEPRITKQELRDPARRADMLWDERAAAFDPFRVRVRALAEAADEVAHVVGLAELAGISWRPRPDGRIEGLIPDAVREGPPELWHEFDQRVQAAERAAAATSAADVQMAFEALREILTAIADALDADR